MKSILKIPFVVLICLLAAAAAFSAGFATHLVLGEQFHDPSSPRVLVVNSEEPGPDETGAFAVYWEAWHLIEQNFLGELPSLQRATYGAIRGVVQELDDPNTVFMEPRRRELERDEHRGRFGGIGVWVYQREDDHQIVLVPQEGSPAEQAGLQEGDVVIKVDDTDIDVATMTRDDVVALIRGPVGDSVRITVQRDADQQQLDFEVVREEFQTSSVHWRMLDDRASDVGYIRITQFTERTGAEVEKALRELEERGATRLVLDLRNNPGGLLDSAIDVASQFLDDGVIMYEHKRDGTERPYPVLQGGLARELPVVVLTNGGTASASEIVAGAVKDHGRGVLVGERTYGKGSVQLVFDLADDSSIHITVAKWLTPAHHQIDGNGIEPDFRIAATSDDPSQGSDAQLTAAVEHLIAMAEIK